MKLDKFTWAVIGVVLLLLVGAVVTVNMTGGSGAETQEYLPLDTPEAPVYNAFLALQRGDYTQARAQYSQATLDQFAKDNYDPFAGRSTSPTSSQRLRILKSEPIADDPDRAIVTFVQDTYNQGGLFGSGSTWSREGTVEVVREDDGWKINTQEFFW
ncbi:MAG: hypothetical protein IT328_20420 [Caldilineaceae bacterium]|nr:hypothetical protein [Caldilineaceae bacterium]